MAKSKSICQICGQAKPVLYYRDSSVGWVCRDCDPMAGVGSFSKKDKIRSRVLMPDGSVLGGRQGLAVQSQRLRVQEKARKTRARIEAGGER
ncbi:MAG: hypothetical protein PHQ43_02705 [Dehalococcoidales bacterium]|nr:hypothetical protein [Dehalococcoidales bacterium]